MQRVEVFKDIYKFFIMCNLDPNYVTNIDAKIKRNEESEDTKQLIKNVQEFHKMRQTLCSKVFKFFNNHELLHKFIKASGLEQYDVVPKNSVCIFTNKKLNEDHGILIILHTSSTKNIFTVHKRFKRILYNFWYLIHFADEINLKNSESFIGNHWNTYVW